MTIKQQGGIFGRNPAYNDVTVDGSVSVDTISEKTSGSGVTIDGFQAINGGAVASANSPKIEISSANANGYNYSLQSTSTGFFNLSQQDGSVLTGDGTILRYNTSGYFDVYQNLAMANGKGIDFSATPGTGTSELFSDYEEGSWSPSYTPTTGSFTTMTYNNREGYYTKIGDLVYINCFISTNNSNPSGGSGVLLISGLPYTCGASEDHSLTISTVINWGGDYPLSGQVVKSSSTIKFQYRTAVNGTTSFLDVSDMATSTSNNRNYIRFSGCYKV